MCVGGRTRSGQRPRGAGRTERGRARFGRIGRPSSFRDGRDRGRAIESIDRRLRACRKTPPEHARVSAPPGRACLKWRAARPDPPLFRLAGRDAARLREPRRGLESSARAAAGFTGRDARRIRTPPASFRSRPTASLLIRSPLVSFRAIGFRGDARTKARARTFSALCRRAVARGFTRFGRRVDEREFLSCRSRADRCGRCGDRRRFAGGLASVEAKLALILRVFETANPLRSRPSSRLRVQLTFDLKNRWTETAVRRSFLLELFHGSRFEGRTRFVGSIHPLLFAKLRSSVTDGLCC